MDIQFHGANCISLAHKQIRVVIDDNLAELGSKGVSKEGDILLYTQSHGEPEKTPKLLIDGPGEYEVTDLSVRGLAARSHTDEEGSKTATMYKIVVDDVRLLATGRIYPELSEQELEAIGTVDILLVPVGGNGYSLDSVGALKLIKEIEPKLVIPTHYADKDLKYPVPQQSLEEALKGLAMEPKDKVAKLKVRPADLSETTQLVIVERS